MREKFRRVLTVIGVALLVVACGSATSGSPPIATTTPSRQPSAVDQSPSAATEPFISGHILFVRTSDGDRGAIFTAEADGTGEHQLTAPGEYGGIVRISPDRSQILTIPDHDPLAPPVTGGTLTVDGSGFVRLPLTDPSLNLIPQAWSPDGTRIAFEGFDEATPARTGVYTARIVDGSDLVRVTIANGAPHDIPLDYSPDGTRLVFYRAVRAEPDFPIDIGGSLWVTNVDGSNADRCWTRDFNLHPSDRGSR